MISIPRPPLCCDASRSQFAITAWAVVVDPQNPLPMLAAMMLVAAVTDALLAVLRGHVFNGPSPNHWDGASGFFVAHCFARALS